MAMRELVFDIFAIDRASATLSRIGGEAETMGGKFGKVGKAIGTGLDIAAAAVIGTGIASVKTAADMETAMTRLTTTAGESSKNIKTVWAGIDAMAGQVGYSVTELASAMYYVESGGYHGAQGLNVLKVAAQGAKIENANVTDVAHALAGAMNDYRKQNIDAATAMNVMTAAVGHGMMTFQDMAEALPKVGARAAATGIKFQELMAAMATMTQDGLPASVAATYLGQTIGQLAAPTAKARDEMKNLGINSVAVSQAITSGSGHGLGDAIKMLYDGITSHLNPAGLVAIETFKKSKGSLTDFQTLVANLPPTLQTGVQALATMTGGVKSFQGILMLGGANTKAYNANLAAMNAQLAAGHGAVAGVAAQQATLNGKLADAKGAWTGLLDVWGQHLLPVVTVLAGKLLSLTGWLSKNGPMVKDLAQAILTAAAAVKVYTAAQWLMNIALDANPLGVTIIALAAMAEGFIYGREHAVQLINALGPFFNWVGTAAGHMAQVVFTAFKWIVDAAMNFGVVVVKAADIAFGWIPGLGPHLHDAVHNMENFRDQTNTALSGVKNKIDIYTNTQPAILGLQNLLGSVPKSMTIPVYLQQMSTGTPTAPSANSLVGLLTGHASGGFVQAGKPIVVGENHPEVFIPQTNGYISPHRPSGQETSKSSGGVTLSIGNFYAGVQSPDQVASALMWKLQHS